MSLAPVGFLLYERLLADDPHHVRMKRVKREHARPQNQIKVDYSTLLEYYLTKRDCGIQKVYASMAFCQLPSRELVLLGGAAFPCDVASLLAEFVDAASLAALRQVSKQTRAAMYCEATAAAAGLRCACAPMRSVRALACFTGLPSTVVARLLQRNQYQASVQQASAQMLEYFGSWDGYLRCLQSRTCRGVLRERDGRCLLEQPTIFARG